MLTGVQFSELPRPSPSLPTHHPQAHLMHISLALNCSLLWSSPYLDDSVLMSWTGTNQASESIGVVKTSEVDFGSISGQ